MQEFITLRFPGTGPFLSACVMLAALLNLANPVQALPVGLIPSPPKVAAASYILMDADSAEVLAEKDADKRLPPASLTKMMTAYVVESELSSGNIGRDDTVTISEKAWRMKGSLMFIEVGEEVRVSDLLKGVIIVSGNDASVALSEYVAGSEGAFAQLMNATAAQFGMINTNFVNASGCPTENHYSSARDLAVLARHVVNDHPDYYPTYKEKTFQYGVDKRTGKPLNPQMNRNTLLFTNPNVDGIKTGHSDEAQYCLVASSERDGRRLIAVIMGAKSERSRTSETQKLLTYGFRFFENIDVKKGGVPLEQVQVWKGTVNALSVGLSNNLVVTVPRGKKASVQAFMEIDQDIMAPVSKGQTVGRVSVKLDEELISEVPLVALESIEQAGFFKRLWDSIALFFTGLFS